MRFGSLRSVIPKPYKDWLLGVGFIPYKGCDTAQLLANIIGSSWLHHQVVIRARNSATTGRSHSYYCLQRGASSNSWRLPCSRNRSWFDVASSGYLWFLRYPGLGGSEIRTWSAYFKALRNLIARNNGRNGKFTHSYKRVSYRKTTPGISQLALARTSSQIKQPLIYASTRRGSLMSLPALLPSTRTTCQLCKLLVGVHLFQSVTYINLKPSP